MFLPKRRPKHWTDKRGRVRPIVARMGGYRQRYKVERSFVWLGNFRRLLIRFRWEHSFAVYHSFFTVALTVLCVRRLTQVDRAGCM